MEAPGSKRIAMNQNTIIQSADLVLGSNAFAVGPTKTDDGSTRLIINSHQPLEGSLAWYEAHITSEEGWNMIGRAVSRVAFLSLWGLMMIWVGDSLSIDQI